MSRPAVLCAVLAAALIVLFSPPVSGQVSLVTTGSVWKYFDQGHEPLGWKGLLFDDSGWTNGPGQFGFGDNDEATRVAQTNAAGLTNITFYFRRVLNVSDPSIFTNLMVRLRRDDGAVVYLNEQEVFRSNMPPGPVSSNTLATTAAQDDGNGTYAGPVSPALLNTGDNQLAVEVHQSSLTSSDVSFDLELLGNVIFQPPAVSLIAPVNGDAVGSTNVMCVAAAGDSDGVITAVEFFDGATWLGSVTTPTNIGYVFNWQGVATGPHILTAVAVDSTGLSAVSAPVSFTVLPALVPRGSVWKYLDNGSDAGPAWKESAFDDNGWSGGPAPLGYGDGDEATVVEDDATPGSPTPNSTTRYITTYFRHSFNADTAGLTNLVLRAQRDDGAIAYLNGAEVFRNNLPTGAVAHTTAALVALDDEQFHAVQVSPALLVSGANVLAVEVHQVSATSSDVSFDLELLPNVPPAPPVVNLTAPAGGATFLGPLNVALNAFALDVDSPVASVTFLDGNTVLGAVGVDVLGGAAGGYLFQPGLHTLRAVATDTMGLSATSAPVSITVIPAPIPATLVATGSVWRFYDTNAAPSGNWRAAGYDDSSWRSGPGILGSNQLGSGSVFPATSINFGPSGNRYITAYFRHSFNVTNAANITNLAFRVLRDDGAVVHLNGTEIFRMNMPTGAVTYATRASAAVSGTNELFYVPINLAPVPGLLLEGANQLAVEIHQDNPATTSDAAFDLGLVAVYPPVPRPLLQIQFDGTSVHLTWNAANAVLLEAAEPQGPYSTNGNTSPFIFSPAQPARYFRLLQP